MYLAVVRIWARHFVAGIGVMIVVLVHADPSVANEAQLRATLAKHYIQNHHAVPLHNHGAVQSGDVLKMPEEATYLPRDKCYSLEPVRYTRLRSEFIRTNLNVAGELGGAMPIQKIAQLKAEVGGEMSSNASILIDPISQEQPSGGFAILSQPFTSRECQIIQRILRGSEREYILVTRVLHGAETASTTLEIGASASVGADIMEKTIRAVLGGVPSLKVSASGSNVEVRYSRSPKEHSLAFQSAVVNLDELARIYLRYGVSSKYQLEVKVQEYLTGSEPDLLAKAAMLIDIALRESGLRRASASELYSAVFSGEGAVSPLEAAPAVPREHWSALAVVAAAHEIVGERR